MFGASIPDELDLATDGVGIRILNARSSASCLDFSAGTYRAASDVSICDLYESDAHIPKGEWAPVENMSCLPPQRDSSNTIALTSVPSRVTAEILALIERRRAVLKPVFNVMDLTCEEVQALTAILAQVPGIRVAEDPKAVARVRYRSGLPTATFNVKTGKQIGLHVDIWDRMGWRNAWKAGNRISINISRSPRYFIFVPIQVCRLACLLMRNNRSLTDDNFNLAAEYFRLHPQAPIYRLRVDPGDAYIAPTENIIHDGIPVASHIDETLVIRGKFELVR